jgi:predicted nucleic acid-binding protein
MAAAALIDTNILVYRFDPRFPEKQAIATKLLREGLRTDSVRIPHQAVLEFMAVVTRVRIGAEPLLGQADATRETEALLDQFRILYPSTAVVRTALRGAVTYQLSWFDAHLWAYAECNGILQLISEDFEHGRLYGSVRARNPFLPMSR